jgi:hypothetical protein
LPDSNHGRSAAATEFLRRIDQVAELRESGAGTSREAETGSSGAAPEKSPGLWIECAGKGSS